VISGSPPGSGRQEAVAGTRLPAASDAFSSGGGRVTPGTRKPTGAFAKQTTSPFTRAPAKTRKPTKTVKQIATTKGGFKSSKKKLNFTFKPNVFKSVDPKVPIKSKRIIFKDSTIAVSPGTVLAPETFTAASLEEVQPTVQIPFVIEGQGSNEGKGAKEDVSIPIMIEEKSKSGGGVNIMSEKEFEKLFGSDSPTSRTPIQVSFSLQSCLQPLLYY
jgi:hypothetical protein